MIQGRRNPCLCPKTHFVRIGDFKGFLKINQKMRAMYPAIGRIQIQIELIDADFKIIA